MTIQGRAGSFGKGKNGIRGWNGGFGGGGEPGIVDGGGDGGGGILCPQFAAVALLYPFISRYNSSNRKDHFISRGHTRANKSQNRENIPRLGSLHFCLSPRLLPNIHRECSC